MMSLWDALRMNMMISYQELVRTFPKRGLMPAYRGEAGQQVNIKIMEYSERNVRQLASNEQEEYIPRKINVGVINTPTLIRSDY